MYMYPSEHEVKSSVALVTGRCNACGEYIYHGRKFNARKETVEGERYLGIPIFRFYIRCTRCLSEITFKVSSVCLLSLCVHVRVCGWSALPVVCVYVDGVFVLLSLHAFCHRLTQRTRTMSPSTEQCAPSRQRGWLRRWQRTREKRRRRRRPMTPCWCVWWLYGSHIEGTRRPFVIAMLF